MSNELCVRTQTELS